MLGTLLISFPLGFLAKGQPHVCFTRPEDFAHENLGVATEYHGDSRVV